MARRGEYSLRADERALLVEAVHTLDGIETIREELAGATERTIVGARGSTAAHPLLAELRKQEAIFAKLLAGVGLAPARIRDRVAPRDPPSPAGVGRDERGLRDMAERFNRNGNGDRRAAGPRLNCDHARQGMGSACCVIRGAC